MQSLSKPSSVDSAPPQSVRLHYLDWLRVLAILGVFLFHAVHPYDYLDWHIKNAELSMVITVILAFFFSWGMPFFFMIAGAGSWFALRRRTARQFASERFRRLFVPFIVGCLLLTPIMMVVEWSHRVQTGLSTGTFQEFIVNRRLPLSPDIFGWFGYHLWFLGFLFSFSLLALPIFLWLRRGAGHALVLRLAKLSERRGAILLAILPLAVIRLGLSMYFPGEHDWGDFFYLMAFFVLGYLLLDDERFTQAVRRDWRIILSVGLVATVVAIAMAAASDSVDTEKVPITLTDFLFLGLVVINGWCWTLFFIYVGMRHLNFTNGWLRYGQEAVLPFFVLHQPVIMIIAYFVVQWDASLLVKLLITVASSFVITIGTYELIIRQVGVLRTMFGMKPKPVEPIESLRPRSV